MSIMTILNQIYNEEIVLPAIQRDFVWPKEKIEKLFDSIIREYPIGMVLLWETYTDTKYRKFDSDYKPGDRYAFFDNDGLTDGEEVYGYEIPTINGLCYTDPADSDTDGDGLSDSEEANGFSILGVGWRYTDPTNPDTDGDGLNDRVEKEIIQIDPRDTDTDDDGYTDYEEFCAGTDPKDPTDYPGSGGWFIP